MIATFESTVLAQPEIAGVVFSYQFGVYEDVRPAFAACRELTQHDGPTYYCDASFRGTFAPSTAWANGKHDDIKAADYALDDDACDARLPLHVAIVHGFAHVATRIIRCRPDLASDDVFFLAFCNDHIEIAELLLDQRPRIAELRRRVHPAADGSVSPASPLVAKAVATMLVRDGAKGLALLERFGLRPDDLPQRDDKRDALVGSTLENATIALDLFPWLYYPGLLESFAARGFLPLVQSLHQRGAACTVDAMRFAVVEGHLDVVKFVANILPEDRTTEVLDDAILGGHLDVVRFLFEHQAGSALPYHLDMAVVSNGRLDVIQYLHGLGTFDCTAHTVDAAVSHGNLPVVQFLLANRCEGCTRDDVVQAALQNGHLDMAEYLLSLGYPFPTSTTLVDEGCFGKLEMLGVLKLLVDHGAPWNDDWMVHACTANNVPLVKLLHPRMSTCSRIDVLLLAMEAHAWDVAHYLLANCLEDLSIEALEAALRFGRIDVASVILERQPELRHHNELLQSAVESRNTEVTRYLLAASIGRPRDCLLEIAGRPAHVTDSKLLLPFCMDAVDHLDNVLYLLQLVELPDRRRATMLQLITAELTFQGKKANQTIPLAPSVAVRATALLEAGDVVDWAQALVISHHCHHGAIALVRDAELQAQLTHLLLSKKRKRSTSTSDESTATLQP
ncbi:hypothetical protein SDRG_10823 [Saprolegnia diclina VS20]|uniref:Uncharacterized protein n=1 Tax=Saprolegnia diclina (strain VS20) TaxID=1156394 RepID=T0RH67_SAPDV|nr:hypothetical protein SDRG_10823 [Saprolegnia diclina VS20]EQC31658.1 hypothetical protein SDRG_10823 [Saprolegnia diclina VS20]|eukprot:XP_008615057.1 hypothetical protein SDRG_10823 [Saprolegnia diclina VS20]